MPMVNSCALYLNLFEVWEDLSSELKLTNSSVDLQSCSRSRGIHKYAEAILIKKRYLEIFENTLEISWNFVIAEK